MIEPVQVSDDTIRHVVHATLEELGIASETSSDRGQMRMDFIWLRRWRRTSEHARRVGIGTLVALFVSGLVGLIVAIVTGGKS